MAIKRKEDSTPPGSRASNHPKKRSTHPLKPRQKVVQDPFKQEDLEEEEDENEEEGEEDDDDDGDDADDDSQVTEPKFKRKNKSNRPKGKDASITYDHFKISIVQEDDSDDADEPLSKILEPFSKDQLTCLLLDAAASHPDVADRLRRMADSDPTHRKIFIHGLGWDTTSETLLNAFCQYGEIEDCKAVVDKVSGRSKGYGFILFKSRHGARNALKEPQKRIGNRMTACQLAAMGPGPSPTPSSSQGPLPHSISEHAQRKIYVSNVGTDLDPRKLYDYFTQFGEIEEGPLGLDRFTGKPKGFCLFIYKTIEGARRALEESHKNFEGHMLHCQKAIEGPKVGKQQQLQNPLRFQRNDNVVGFPGGVGVGQLVGGQLAVGGIGFAQGAAVAPALNPGFGQAITALLATQGAGFDGLTNFLGSLGASAAINRVLPAAGQSLQAAYGNQVSVSPVVIGGYGTQSGYPQQMAPGAAGRGQNSAQFGGTGPFIGH
ncbi:hypothetical protein MLD38_035117 [Melastoma candidum]|uniref:Uncharacterized protein n=1 Tax=Melastoma candidum TaxID=119954 RepID=A0ACB9MEB9_9MYRT|nr:hypothetical protein MLD38_035117 [Melastoma candidum]